MSTAGVSVIGTGEADLFAGGRRSSMELVTSAVRRALEDAGVSRAQVDGVLTGYSLMEGPPMYADAVAEYLGLDPGYCTTLNSGGATGCMLVRHAAQAIAAGRCETVVVAWGDNRRSGFQRSEVVDALAAFAHPEYELPYGPTLVGLYALAASRYLHEYDATPDDLAEVAVLFRAHAGLNPVALKRDAISIDDVRASPQIASPLRLLDCCLISDFGGALVLSAGPRGGRSAPVAVLGSGEAHPHEHIVQAATLTRSGCEASARVALEQAAVGPDELDVAQLYDSFTITVLIQLEDLGIAERGSAGALFRAGHFGLDGALPLNTNGGMLSAVNGGIHHVIEAVVQLQGRAGPRQVPDCRRAFVHGIGGVLSSHCSLVLGV